MSKLSKSRSKQKRKPAAFCMIIRNLGAREKKHKRLALFLKGNTERTQWQVHISGNSVAASSAPLVMGKRNWAVSLSDVRAAGPTRSPDAGARMQDALRMAPSWCLPPGHTRHSACRGTPHAPSDSAFQVQIDLVSISLTITIIYIVIIYIISNDIQNIWFECQLDVASRMHG